MDVVRFVFHIVVRPQGYLKIRDCPVPPDEPSLPNRTNGNSSSFPTQETGLARLASCRGPSNMPKLAGAKTEAAR